MTSVTPWWKVLKLRKEILNASGQLAEVRMWIAPASLEALACRYD
jgi:hypothetical protein